MIKNAMSNKIQNLKNQISHKKNILANSVNNHFDKSISSTKKPTIRNTFKYNFDLKEEMMQSHTFQHYNKIKYSHTHDSISYNNILNKAYLLNNNENMKKFQYDKLSDQAISLFNIKSTLSNICINYIANKLSKLPQNNNTNIEKKSILNIFSKCILKFLILK